MKFTNKYNLPGPVVQAVVDAEQGTPIATRGLPPMRVTSLIDSPRRVQLTKRHWDEIEIDVSECLYALDGASIHYILQHARYDINCDVEERLYEEVNGVWITGQIDLYERAEKRISDYKKTSVWSYIFGLKSEWEAQVNIYAWLERKKKREVESAQIVAFLRDHNTRRGNQEEDYPDVPMVVMPVELWNNGHVEEYIKLRLREHADAERGLRLDVCTAEERWARPDKWAVRKKGNKRALRVFDSYYEAEEEGVIQALKGVDIEIEHRPGEDVRCQSYCRVARYCSYWQEKYGPDQTASPVR